MRGSHTILPRGRKRPAERPGEIRQPGPYPGNALSRSAGLQATCHPDMAGHRTSENSLLQQSDKKQSAYNHPCMTNTAGSFRTCSREPETFADSASPAPAIHRKAPHGCGICQGAAHVTLFANGRLTVIAGIEQNGRLPPFTPRLPFRRGSAGAWTGARMGAPTGRGSSAHPPEAPGPVWFPGARASARRPFRTVW